LDPAGHQDVWGDFRPVTGMPHFDLKPPRLARLLRIASDNESAHDAGMSDEEIDKKLEDVDKSLDNQQTELVSHSDQITSIEGEARKGD
jgi:hypothetical protein